MEHKGVEYSVIRLTDGGWRWEVKFGDGKNKSGLTRVRRALAIKIAKYEIDRVGKDRSKAASVGGLLRFCERPQGIGPSGGLEAGADA